MLEVDLVSVWGEKLFSLFEGRARSFSERSHLCLCPWGDTLVPLRGDALVLVWGETVWSLSERKCPSPGLRVDVLVSEKGHSSLFLREVTLVSFCGEMLWSLWGEMTWSLSVGKYPGPFLREVTLVSERRRSGLFLREVTLVSVWEEKPRSLPEGWCSGPRLRGDALVLVWVETPGLCLGGDALFLVLEETLLTIFEVIWPWSPSHIDLSLLFLYQSLASIPVFVAFLLSYCVLC